MPFCFSAVPGKLGVELTCAHLYSPVGFPSLSGQDKGIWSMVRYKVEGLRNPRTKDTPLTGPTVGTGLRMGGTA